MRLVDTGLRWAWRTDQPQACAGSNLAPPAGLHVIGKPSREPLGRWKALDPIRRGKSLVLGPLEGARFCHVDMDARAPRN